MTINEPDGIDPSPYRAPQSELPENRNADDEQRRRGHGLAMVGTLLFTGPIWGAIGTVLAMIRAFQALGVSEGGDPGVLAGDIQNAMVAAAIGIFVGLIGLVLVLLALLRSKNRERWFFRWSLGLSIFWCLAIFPYGLIVGIPVVLLFLARRDEFRGETSVSG